MEVVFNRELSELLIISDVGGDHYAVKPIGHIDEILDRKKLIGVNVAEPLLEERLINGKLLLGERVQPLGKVV